MDMLLAANAKKKQRLKELEEEKNEEEEQEQEECEEEEGEEVPVEKAGPSIHHLHRCVVPTGCRGYEGPNPKQHLRNVHVKKNTILEQDVDRFLLMGLKAKS